MEVSLSAPTSVVVAVYSKMGFCCSSCVILGLLFVVGYGTAESTATSFALTFDLMPGRQLPSSQCIPLEGFAQKSSLACATTCSWMPECEGFYFRCLDPDPLTLTISCHCEICTLVTAETSVSKPGSISGVVQSKKDLTLLPLAEPVTASLGTLMSSAACTLTTTSDASTSPRPPPPCGYPPLIARTTVNFTATSDRTVATYRCSVTSDKYIRGTTEITCTVGSAWPNATILCAPTTCYHDRHAVWGPVYAGTATAPPGSVCQRWDRDTPVGKSAPYKQGTAYRSDNDSMTAAANYCRIFDDGSSFTWCYVSSGYSTDHWIRCTVPACPTVPGTLIP